MILSKNMYSAALMSGLAAIGISTCIANDNLPLTTNECTGRMQLTLPGEVDIATNSAKMLIKEHKLGSLQPKFEFEDGRGAGRSEIHFLGSILLSPPLTDLDRSTLLNLAEESVQRAKNGIVKFKKKGYSFKFEQLNVNPHLGKAFRVDSGYDAELFVGQSMIWLQSSGSGETWESQEKNYKAFLAGVSARPIGVNPDIPGVCLPYFFVKFDNSEGRDIATTYQLKAHPDVTIWLKDSNAAEYGNPIREENAQPQNRHNDFWTQYEHAKNTRQVDTIWDFPALRSVKLAGQEGLASFVKITRKDNSIDYGYFAAVRGDPKAKQDTPDLQFYVIRTAANAKTKGMEPIGEKEFLEIAQAIATSIKHRTEEK